MNFPNINLPDIDLPDFHMPTIRRTKWKYVTSGGGMVTFGFVSGGYGTLSLKDKHSGVVVKTKYLAGGGGVGIPGKAFELLNKLGKMVLKGIGGGGSAESFKSTGRIIPGLGMPYNLREKYLTRDYLIFSADLSLHWGGQVTFIIYPKHHVYNLFSGGLERLAFIHFAREIAAIGVFAGARVGIPSAQASAVIAKTIDVDYKYPPKSHVGNVNIVNAVGNAVGGAIEAIKSHIPHIPDFPHTPPFPGLLRMGSHGNGVRQVQQRLRQRGWRITVDGAFGPEMDRVVRAFQREKHLEVDGIVGHYTWGAIWGLPITR